MKPKASSQGKGITVIDSFEQVPRGAGAPPCLVQQYIANPMLIGGHKFDLRVYVAVTSVNPLRVYTYEEGLCRFATELYDTDDLTNVYSHLTNYSINKKNEDLKNRTTASTSEKTKSKWSLKAFKQYLAGKEHDVDALWSQINDICLKTVISAEPLLWNGVEMHCPNTY